MDHSGRRLRRCSIVPLVAAVALVSIPSLAVAQSDPFYQMGQVGDRRESEPQRVAPGSSPVTVHGPSQNDTVAPDHAMLPTTTNMQTSFALEEPIDPRKYVCGRGDIFDLDFWGQQNLHSRVTVDTEGRIFVPKMGYLDIAGKTLADAREALKKQMHRYYPGLSFDLSLVSPRTFAVHVVGFVPHPGLYVANPIVRVGTILSNAGMLPEKPLATPTQPKSDAPPPGSRRHIEITRRDGTHVSADLVLYELTGDTKLNPFVMDGDVIRVPFPEVVATISGAVKRPGQYELIASKDLSELLDLAGGFRPTLTTQLPVRVIHRDRDEHESEVKISVGADRSVPKQPLRDQDTVIVPGVSELQRTVLLIGPVVGATATDEVTSVRRLDYFEGATVRQLIETAGGLGASADLKNSYIQRNGGEIERLDLEKLLVLRDFSADRPVHIGDSIVVPQKRRAVLIEGAVMHPGIVPFNPMFRGQEYISAAGGPAKNARSDSTYRVVSADGSSRKLADAVKIQPGDSILVPERSFSRSEVVQLVLGGVGLVISSVSLAILVIRY